MLWCSGAGGVPSDKVELVPCARGGCVLCGSGWRLAGRAGGRRGEGVLSRPGMAVCRLVPCTNKRHSPAGVCGLVFVQGLSAENSFKCPAKAQILSCILFSSFQWLSRGDSDRGGEASPTHKRPTLDLEERSCFVPVPPRPPRPAPTHTPSRCHTSWGKERLLFVGHRGSAPTAQATPNQPTSCAAHRRDEAQPGGGARPGPRLPGPLGPRVARTCHQLTAHHGGRRRYTALRARAAPAPREVLLAPARSSSWMP